MPLDEMERRTTKRELQHNMEFSGWTDQRLADVLGMDLGAVQKALEVPEESADIWAVRDALEAAAEQAGHEPQRYSCLVEGVRGGAAQRMNLRPQQEIRDLVFNAPPWTPPATPNKETRHERHEQVKEERQDLREHAESKEERHELREHAKENEEARHEQRKLANEEKHRHGA